MIEVEFLLTICENRSILQICLILLSRCYNGDRQILREMTESLNFKKLHEKLNTQSEIDSVISDNAIDLKKKYFLCLIHLRYIFLSLHFLINQSLQLATDS